MAAVSSPDDPPPPEVAEGLAAALDISRPIADRLAAIEAFAKEAPDAAKLRSLRLAERIGEPRAIHEAAGVALAKIEHQGVRVSQLDMANISEAAYIAYDEWRPSQ